MEFQPPEINFAYAAALTIVAGTGMLLMLLELFVPKFVKRRAALIAFIGLVIAFIQTLTLWSSPGATFTPDGGTPMLVADNFAVFLNIVFLLTGMLTILLSVDFLRRTDLERPEFYMLMMFSISGMMLMGMANDLILIFLALELLSIPLYIMAGLAWPRTDSEESSMKYFLLGAFSSSVFVFGIAFIYGATGTTSIPGLVEAIGEVNGLLLAGVAFLLVGFGFKVAAAPFQMWTPDVYEGAPTPVTAFMSVGAKVGGFAALLRILLWALPSMGETWVPAIVILATLTLIIGNIAAIVQKNIKRMLGYSSIAHAGFILIAVAASYQNPDGVSAALFYMFAYLFTNLGAFAIVVAMEHQQGQGVFLDDYKGLAKQHPLMALVMAFFMMSLTGIPLTGGFAAKFFVLRTAIDANLIGLALVGVITSVVSAFYYLRVVYLMYMYEGDAKLIRNPALVACVWVTAIATLFLGILPAWGFEFAQTAVAQSLQAIASGG